MQCACRWLHDHVYRALGRRREVAVVTLPTYSEKVLQQPFDELFVPLNSKINAIGRTYTLHHVSIK